MKETPPTTLRPPATKRWSSGAVPLNRRRKPAGEGLAELPGTAGGLPGAAPPISYLPVILSVVVEIEAARSDRRRSVGSVTGPASCGDDDGPPFICNSGAKCVS